MGHSDPPPEETVTRKSSFQVRQDGAAIARTRPTLVFMAGARMGEACRLPRGETLIGRGRQCGIRLDEQSISRTHARIVVDRGGVWIEDLQSSNGTVVNTEQVTRVDLHDGDKIQLGESSILKFTLTDPLDESFHNQLYNAAMRDPLTGVFNRSYLVESIDKSLAYARRHNVPVGLLIFDIDFFKRVNDTHGHLAGDAVLQQIARAVRATLRTEDVLARYGGEEFCVLCPGTHSQGALLLAERVRRIVEGQRVTLSDGTKIGVTVSIGVATFPEVRSITSTEFLAAADSALFQAKEAGRNRVVSANESEPDLSASPTQSKIPLRR